MSVNRLIAASPPLDTNSIYCNLLQCTYFSSTSIIAKNGDKCLGFVSAYLVPERSDTLFIWQIAVSEAARGQGLGKKMLRSLLSSKACQSVHFIETTITKSNRASWGLFKSLAGDLNADFEESLLFDRVEHFEKLHDSENLLRIGPFEHQK